METLLQQIVNGIALGGAIALFALGFSLVFGVLRIFNVAHGAVFAWAALTSYWTVATLGMPIWTGLLAALLGGGTLSVALDHVAFRPLRARRSAEFTYFICAMGGSMALTGLAQSATQSQVLRLPLTAFPNFPVSAGLIQVTFLQATMVLVSVALFVGLSFLLKRTRMGRAIRAVAYDQRAAALLGVDVNAVIRQVFFLSGSLAGLAALLVALTFHVIEYQMGEGYLITAFAVIILGGFGSIAGTFIAGYLIGITNVLSMAYLSSTYRDVIVFSILIALLMVRPTGLFGAREAE